MTSRVLRIIIASIVFSTLSCSKDLTNDDSPHSNSPPNESPDTRPISPDIDLQVQSCRGYIPLSTPDNTDICYFKVYADAREVDDFQIHILNNQSNFYIKNKQLFSKSRERLLQLPMVFNLEFLLTYKDLSKKITKRFEKYQVQYRDELTYTQEFAYRQIDQDIRRLDFLLWEERENKLFAIINSNELVCLEVSADFQNIESTTRLSKKLNYLSTNKVVFNDKKQLFYLDVDQKAISKINLKTDETEEFLFYNEDINKRSKLYLVNDNLWLVNRNNVHVLGQLNEELSHVKTFNKEINELKIRNIEQIAERGNRFFLRTNRKIYEIINDKRELKEIYSAARWPAPRIVDLHLKENHLLIRLKNETFHSVNLSTYEQESHFSPWPQATFSHSYYNRFAQKLYLFGEDGLGIASKKSRSPYRVGLVFNNTTRDAIGRIVFNFINPSQMLVDDIGQTLFINSSDKKIFFVFSHQIITRQN